MRAKIAEIADILDDVIEKGERVEEDFLKSFSHDPFSPVDMSGNQAHKYYNPYKWAGDGFLPQDESFWTSQGDRTHTIQQNDGRTRTIVAPRGDYRNSRNFYNTHTTARRAVSENRPFRGFGDITKSITVLEVETIEKSSTLPPEYQ